jgi:short-subunit dehydrogenase
MTAADVARIGYEGFKAGKPLVIAGRRNRLMQLMVGVLPRRVVRKSVRQLNQNA